jgi:precorrin-6B methylase 2
LRSLVFNARPRLIQSSVEIDHVGALGPKVLGTPPPLVGLTATHLGGLALAVPLWLASNKTAPGKDATNKPRAIVIGAGGCTIPAVLAKAGCDVTAIEPNIDVLEAACRHFGAEDAAIKLIAGYGEEYLAQETRKVDLLIIDAEDGKSAPPQSMREESFWGEVVLSRLEPDAIVAVNVIADQNERAELRRIVDKALESHDVWCCEVPEVACVSDRHCIMFATPASTEFDAMRHFKEELNKFEYVDLPEEWFNKIEDARTFRYYTSYFDSCNNGDKDNGEEEGRK